MNLRFVLRRLSPSGKRHVYVYVATYAVLDGVPMEDIRNRDFKKNKEGKALFMKPDDLFADPTYGEWNREVFEEAVKVALEMTRSQV